MATCGSCGWSGPDGVLHGVGDCVVFLKLHNGELEKHWATLASFEVLANALEAEKTNRQRVVADFERKLKESNLQNGELQKERDQLREMLHNEANDRESEHAQVQDMVRLNVSLQKELTQMGDHAARLRVCLLRWGNHFAGCPIGERTGDKCECGLEANIEAVPGEMLTSNDIKPTRETILKGLWQLLRAYAGGGMPPLITKGIRLACQNVGMSEDHIASAELGGDDPDFIKQETEKRFCECRPITYQENGATGNCIKCGLPPVPGTRFPGSYIP